MFLIEYYEIIFREKTNAIGFAYNFKLYNIGVVEPSDVFSFQLKENNSLEIYNSDTHIITFTDIPEEYIETLKEKESILIIAAEPSAHPEDEAPDFELIKTAYKKS